MTSPNAAVIFPTSVERGSVLAQEDVDAASALLSCNMLSYNRGYHGNYAKLNPRTSSDLVSNTYTDIYYR